MNVSATVLLCPGRGGIGGGAAALEPLIVACRPTILSRPTLIAVMRSHPVVPVVLSPSWLTGSSKKSSTVLHFRSVIVCTIASSRSSQAPTEASSLSLPPRAVPLLYCDPGESAVSSACASCMFAINCSSLELPIEPCLSDSSMSSLASRHVQTARIREQLIFVSARSCSRTGFQERRRTRKRGAYCLNISQCVSSGSYHDLYAKCTNASVRSLKVAFVSRDFDGSRSTQHNDVQ